MYSPRGSRLFLTVQSNIDDGQYRNQIVQPNGANVDDVYYYLTDSRTHDMEKGMHESWFTTTYSTKNTRLHTLGVYLTCIIIKKLMTWAT